MGLFVDKMLGNDSLSGKMGFFVDKTLGSDSPFVETGLCPDKLGENGGCPADWHLAG